MEKSIKQQKLSFSEVVDLREDEEWRERISIPSLDRIFGDGSSFYDNKCRVQSEIFQENESVMSRELSPLGSKSASLLDMRQSTQYVETTTTSFNVKSMSINTSKTTSRSKPKMLTKRTEEFGKSVDPSNKNTYFFKLAPVEKRLRMKMKSPKYELSSTGEITEEEDYKDDNLSPEEIRNRIQEIDKTIEKLLRRGADPNLSEVPKPSIHLGVYTKNAKIVNLLQSYGANPNAKLYANEGLLTPLHLVVLLKPSLEYISICKLLLDSGADPEEKTFPGFVFYEEERKYLDPREGRTPLQLLCMRPDLEYADPEGHSTKIALLLSERCDRTRLYMGHSYLSLAMYFGNVKLLNAMLCSKLFDPDATLGDDKGTLLHVLVSNEFQKRTSFETSSRIFEDILKAGANLQKQIKHSKRFSGSFIDFGFREIEEEKELRKFLAEKKEIGRKVSRKTKLMEGDYLPDHMKLLKYVIGRTEGDESQLKGIEGKGAMKFGEGKEKMEQDKKGKVEIDRTEREGDRKERERREREERERAEREKREKEKGDKGKGEKDKREKDKREKDKREKDKREKEKKETELQLQKKKSEKAVEVEETEEERERRRAKEKKVEGEEEAEEDVSEKDDGKDKKKRKKKEKIEKEQPVRKRVLIVDTDVTIINDRKRERRIRDWKTWKTEKEEVGTEEEGSKVGGGVGGGGGGGVGGRVWEGKHAETSDEMKESLLPVYWVKTEAPVFKMGKEGLVNNEKTVERKNAKNRENGINRENDKSRENGKNKENGKNRENVKNKENGKKEEKNLRRQEQRKDSKKTEMNLKPKSFVKPMVGKQSSSLEAFPEKLRKSILNILGHYANVDVTDLFLPYVVLRDGDLYYGLKGRSSWGKEQYSLV